MEYINNIIEYHEELYPVTDIQKTFYKDITDSLMPAHILRIGCGSGALEHYLARAGHDVTGIDVSRELLACANRRRRMPNTSVRFFQMSSLEMTRFLGKNFYNVISCLENKLIYIHDETLLRKFFYDCRQLLAQHGRLVLEISNFNKFNAVPMAQLPVRESIRVKLITQVWTNDDGSKLVHQDLERCGSNKTYPVLRGEPVMTITPDEVKMYAREAGFLKIELYSGFDRTPFTEDSETALFVLS